MEIITFFLSDESWAEFRNKNSGDLSKLKVICDNIDSYNEISSSCGEVFKLDKSTSFLNMCKIISENVVVNGSECLFIEPSRYADSYALEFNGDVYCKKIEKNEESIIQETICIFDLDKRADFIKKSNGFLLDSSFILGTADFWSCFTGFQDFLFENKYFLMKDTYFKQCGDIALSLFNFESNSFSFKTGELNEQ